MIDPRINQLIEDLIDQGIATRGIEQHDSENNSPAILQSTIEWSHCTRLWVEGRKTESKLFNDDIALGI